MSLRSALLKCFEDEPNRIFSIQDLCSAVQKYYAFTDFQRELDPKHPQPRYEHQIRSRINKLKGEHIGERIINRLDRDQYKLV